MLAVQASRLFVSSETVTAILLMIKVAGTLSGIMVAYDDLLHDAVPMTWDSSRSANFLLYVSQLFNSS
jgi:hypothetical protein